MKRNENRSLTWISGVNGDKVAEISKQDPEFQNIETQNNTRGKSQTQQYGKIKQTPNPE